METTLLATAPSVGDLIASRSKTDLVKEPISLPEDEFETFMIWGCHIPLKKEKEVVKEKREYDSDSADEDQEPDFLEKLAKLNLRIQAFQSYYYKRQPIFMRKPLVQPPIAVEVVTVEEVII